MRQLGRTNFYERRQFATEERMRLMTSCQQICAVELDTYNTYDGHEHIDNEKEFDHEIALHCIGWFGSIYLEVVP